MFREWLTEHDLAGISFDERLFPPASDRAFWEAVTSEKQVRDAEKYLGYEWPLIRATQFMEFQKSGNRLVQETPFFSRRLALLNLFLGEIAEHKGRFLPDICDGIFLICEETHWGVAAHSPISRPKDLIPCASDPYIDLFAAETAELLTVIRHVLGEEIRAFCPPLTERIEYELDRRMVTPYLNHCDFWWMGYNGNTVNNWNPWILSCLATVFLTAGLRRSTLERGLKKMLQEIDSYYNVMPDDGGCDEGSNYWTKAGAKLFAFCDRLYIASGGAVDFFHDDKLKKIGLYPTHAYMDGFFFVNFSDGNSRMGTAILDYELYVYGKRTGEEALCRLAATLKRERLKASPDAPSAVRGSSAAAVLNALIYADEIDAQPDYIPPEYCLLPDLQNAYMRAGSWYYAAKGGHNNEQHNHNDVGSLIVRHGTQPMLIDPGCGTYTRFTFSELRYTIWTMQSGWHNLPVINGCEQPAGKEYRADRFSVTDKTTEVSFAGAYPAGAEVSEVCRRIDIAENGVTVTDSFAFAHAENTVEEHFMTLLQPEETEDGILLGGRYLLQTDVPCRVGIDRKDFTGDAKLTAAWEADHLWRIRLGFDCGETAKITVRVTAVP